MSITKYLFDALNNGTELYPSLAGGVPVNSYDILQGKINSNRFSVIAEDMRLTGDTDILIVAKAVNTSVPGGIYSSSSPSLLKGLYYIPAVLHTDGTFSFTQNKLPYFNEEFFEGDIVFGNRSRAHSYFANNPRLISAIYGNGSWEAYVKLATAYFEEVCGIPYNECYITNRADNSSFIFDQNCYIVLSRPVKETKPMLRLYARIFKAGDEPNKLYRDMCCGVDEDVSFITLTAEEKTDFICKVAANWIINSALARVPARPIVIGSDISPSLRIADIKDDLFSYWSEVKSSVQSLPAYDTSCFSAESVYAACARRYGVSFSSATGCIDRIYRELSSLSVLNDRVVNEVKSHPGLVSFPVNEGKRITFAASQTMLKCEETEKILRERRGEWETFIQQLPRRVRAFGGLSSVKEERKRIFTEFMNETDTFIDAEMTPQQILNAFADAEKKNLALMKETAAKKKLLDLIGEYSEYGIDFFSADNDDIFECTEQDINRLIMKKVTPTLFWLSVHYYECMWASDPEGNPYTLSPVLIAPYRKIAEQFDEFDSIPLLILDHADSISPEYAAGLFALAKTAILICDGGESAPVHTVPAGTDPLLAIRAGAVAYADEFGVLRSKGLSVSSCSVADCFRT